MNRHEQIGRQRQEIVKEMLGIAVTVHGARSAKSLRNMDEFRDAAAQVQKRMELDGAFGPAKSRPREQRQA